MFNFFSHQTESNSVPDPLFATEKELHPNFEIIAVKLRPEWHLLISHYLIVRNDSKLTLTQTTLSNTLIMTKSVMISLLRKGNNGSQILEILESISQGANEQQVAQVAAEPTLIELEF